MSMYTVTSTIRIDGKTAGDVVEGVAARLEEVDTGEWTAVDRIVSVIAISDDGSDHDYYIEDNPTASTLALSPKVREYLAALLDVNDDPPAKYSEAWDALTAAIAD